MYVKFFTIALKVTVKCAVKCAYKYEFRCVLKCAFNYRVIQISSLNQRSTTLLKSMFKFKLFTVAHKCAQ